MALHFTLELSGLANKVVRARIEYGPDSPQADAAIEALIEEIGDDPDAFEDDRGFLGYVDYWSNRLVNEAEEFLARHDAFMASHGLKAA